MNAFEQLWNTYLKMEFGERRPDEDELKALRRAFFLGAWCQMKFARRLQSMERGAAMRLQIELELELSGEVEIVPRLEAGRWRTADASRGAGEDGSFDFRSDARNRQATEPAMARSPG